MARAFFVAVSAGAFVAFAACETEPAIGGSDGGASTSSSGGGSSSSGGSSSGGSESGADSTPPLPQAKGDPCRGVELPSASHYVPNGLCARVVSAGVTGLRQIAFAPNGVLFGAAGAAIWRFEDEDDDGFFAPQEIVNWAPTAGNSNSVHIDVDNGYLYTGTFDGVVRYKWTPASKAGGTAEDVIVNQPGGGHSIHTAHVYDGYLYVESGSADNASNSKSDLTYDDQRSLVKRFELASFNPTAPWDFLASGEIVSRGLRNMNGFTRNAAKRIYGVVNGLDAQSYGGNDVHEDNPGEQIVQIEMGKNFGYPFCFTAQAVRSDVGTVIEPGTQLANLATFANVGQTDTWCATNSAKPATFIQAHSAPLDITFFDNHPVGGLPEKYRGGAFVALHGSWNRTIATGYKVIWVPFDAQGKAPMPTTTDVSGTLKTTFPYETILGGGDATGATDLNWSWSSPPYFDAPRFSGVAIGPIDGALYMSTDSGGIIYRVGAKK